MIYIIEDELGDFEGIQSVFEEDTNSFDDVRELIHRLLKQGDYRRITDEELKEYLLAKLGNAKKLIVDINLDENNEIDNTGIRLVYDYLIKEFPQKKYIFFTRWPEAYFMDKESRTYSPELIEMLAMDNVSYVTKRYDAYGDLKKDFLAELKN